MDVAAEVSRDRSSRRLQPTKGRTSFNRLVQSIREGKQAQT
jgi:hypothetical protein